MLTSLERKDDSTLIFGRQPVMEALASGKQIDRVFLKKGAEVEFSTEIKQIARELDVPVNVVPIEKLNRLTRKNHQGIAAFVLPVQFYKVEDIIAQAFDLGQVPLILVLDGITDVYNFGAIARTAWCAGCHAIVIGARESAPVNGPAIKASAGALLEIPICRTTSFGTSLKEMQRCGLMTIGAESEGSEALEKVDMKIPMAIVVGAEGKGLSNDSKRFCEKYVNIPMQRDFDSYNVSVSAAMMLYEVMRQRQ